MSDDLLRFYNAELDFLRNLGKEFAKAHPKTAGYLSLGGDEEYDPHVGRMIQAFAYLNARTRQKLEDDFPEVSGSMLDILYPHYQQPIPSMAILQFRLDRSQGDLTSGYVVESHSMLKSEPVKGHSCRFRTCYPVESWPIEISEATYKGLPFEAPQTPFSGNALAAIKMSFDTLIGDIKFNQMKIQKLRFYIRLQSYFGHHLYELLMNHLLGMAVVPKPGEPPVILDTSRIRPVGFDRDEGMLPCPARSFHGFRLLTEYFAFPEKFMFFDVDLGPSLQNIDSNHAELYFYIDQHWEDLESRVNEETFCLGCTPVINLFTHRCEPLRLNHFESEHPVLPDARAPEAFEVLSIDNVRATDSLGTESEFKPFYSTRHWHHESEPTRFWHSSRYESSGGDSDLGRGQEVRIAFVDLEFSPAKPESLTIDIEASCFNRNLPRHLEFDGRGRPNMDIEKGSVIRHIACLTKPTSTYRPQLRHGSRWRLVSLLSLGHLSLTGSEGLSVLKELLELHDLRNVELTKKNIAGILSIKTRPTVGRVGKGSASGVCRGIEVEITFDEDQFKEGGMYLLASVLERFFGWYANINSFVQTVVKSNKHDGVIRKWPPRAGDRVLL